MYTMLCATYHEHPLLSEEGCPEGGVVKYKLPSEQIGCQVEPVETRAVALKKHPKPTHPFDGAQGDSPRTSPQKPAPSNQ
jgi:hypothetical protein